MLGKLQFGVYELDRDAMELRKHGLPLRLQEQPFRILAALVERPGQIVTREELRELIWGKDTFVDFEQSLNKAVNRVREALNDDAGHPQYVETVPRRGYRFIAPVTQNGPTEQAGPTASSSPVSNPDKKTFEKHKFRFVKIVSLVVAGILVASGVAGVVLLRKPRKPTLRESKHMTSVGFGPTLSRDGKLLAYGSTVGGMRVWVQQTAGGEAIRVTSGPDLDLQGDLSPDGTHIVFLSGRGLNGIYIAPTLPGEARLLVKGDPGSLGFARFSPTGDKILYLTDHYKAFTAPVDGSPPALLGLNRDFRLDGPHDGRPAEMRSTSTGSASARRRSRAVGG